MAIKTIVEVAEEIVRQYPELAGLPFPEALKRYKQFLYAREMNTWKEKQRKRREKGRRKR